MGNLYDARLSNGQTYTVETNRHHNDHSDDDFKRHLLDIIKSSVAGVISGTVVQFLHRGRR